MRRFVALVVGFAGAGCFSEFGIDGAGSGADDGSATAETVDAAGTSTTSDTLEDVALDVTDAVDADAVTAPDVAQDDTVTGPEVDTGPEVEDDTHIEPEVVEDDTLTEPEVDTGPEVEDDTHIEPEVATGPEVEDDVTAPDGDADDDAAVTVVGDRCDDPLPVVAPVTGVVVSHTLDDTMRDDYVGCGAPAEGSDLVWRVELATPGDWSFVVTPTGFDAIVHVYADAACTTCARGIDDGLAGEPEAFTHRASQTGEALWVVVDSPAGSTGGAVTLEVRRAPHDCDRAIALVRDRAWLHATGDLRDAALTDSFLWSDCLGSDDGTPQGNVVFALTAPWTGRWSIMVSPGADVDVRWHLRDGGTCEESGCLAEHDDAGPGAPENGAVSLVGGETYWVVVDSRMTAELDGGVTITVEPAARAQLAEARADLTAGIVPGDVWPIEGAVVVAHKPPLANDLHGFVIQATPEGPALLIETPSPWLVSVGDAVSLTLTGLRTFFGVPSASSFRDLVVHERVDLGGWAQDVSGIDPVAVLGALELELVDLDGVVVELPTDAGTGHVGFRVKTAGYSTPSVAFRVRVSAADDTSRILPGCAFSLRDGFMWRYQSYAQPTTYDSAALTFTCPKARVVRATAESNTTVRVWFDRAIDPTSVAADGSQFDFGGLLVPTSAAVDGPSVLVTTGSQVDIDYQVVVAGGVRDILGDTIADTERTATFLGFVSPVGLVVNEVDYDQPVGGDPGEFIELFNGTGHDVDAWAFQLELMNGVSRYETLPLSGRLPPGGYLVVARASLVASADVVLTFEALTSVGVNGVIQNGGDDGIRLTTVAGELVDALLYEATTALPGISEGALFTGGENNSDPNRSLQRCPDGHDTQNNQTDFSSGAPSPGAANCP